MNCQEIQIIIEQAIEEGAAFPDQVAGHLATCAGCAAHREELTRLWAALDFLPTIQPNPGFQARFWRQAQEMESAAGWRSGWAAWLAMALRPRSLAGMTLLLLLLLGSMLIINRSGLGPMESNAPSASLEDDRLLESLSLITESSSALSLANFDLWEADSQEPPAFPTPLLTPPSSLKPETLNRGAGHEKIG